MSEVPLYKSIEPLEPLGLIQAHLGRSPDPLVESPGIEVYGVVDRG